MKTTWTDKKIKRTILESLDSMSFQREEKEWKGGNQWKFLRIQGYISRLKWFIKCPAKMMKQTHIKAHHCETSLQQKQREDTTSVQRKKRSHQHKERIALDFSHSNPTNKTSPTAQQHEVGGKQCFHNDCKTGILYLARLLLKYRVK